jgi:hypothetical protein
MTTPACSLCRFRHADARPEYVGAGECRRFPPTPTVTTGFDGSSQYEQHWPWMAAGDWCGEFQTSLTDDEVQERLLLFRDLRRRQREVSDWWGVMALVAWIIVVMVAVVWHTIK